MLETIWMTFERRSSFCSRRFSLCHSGLPSLILTFVFKWQRATDSFNHQRQWRYDHQRAAPVSFAVTRTHREILELQVDLTDLQGFCKRAKKCRTPAYERYQCAVFEDVTKTPTSTSSLTLSVVFRFLPTTNKFLYKVIDSQKPTPSRATCYQQRCRYANNTNAMPLFSFAFPIEPNLSKSVRHLYIMV